MKNMLLRYLVDAADVTAAVLYHRGADLAGATLGVMGFFVLYLNGATGWAGAEAAAVAVFVLWVNLRGRP